MPGFAELPPELILVTVSFLTRETILDPHYCLARYTVPHESQLVPDLPSINALSQTNSVFHYTLDQTLYDLCAGVEPIAKLAILFAVQHQSQSTLDRLVAAGVSLDAEYSLDLPCEDCSLLHIAAAMGLRGMVVKLLGMYGERMTTTRQGSTRQTPLDYAAHFGHMEIVKLLAPIPPPTSQSDLYAQYLGVALHEAVVQAGNVEISRYLISAGADVNFCDHGHDFMSSPPLSYAVGAKNLGLVQLLLASGADPNLHNNDSTIPLFTAVRTENMAIVQALVDAGADIHVQNAGLFNVISYCGSIEFIHFFLERGVDPNSEDTTGYTALHDACMEWRRPDFARASVELLCQFGAAPDKTNLDGKTPLDLAMSYGLSDVVAILEPLVQGHDVEDITSGGI
ncbi:ankyrin repeat-containing domain protein [Mycena galopus ATCC 62051]|nr:ankyrin repeat-containing domain protein [Mycena galopus ATCC 62051]